MKVPTPSVVLIAVCALVVASCSSEDPAPSTTSVPTTTTSSTTTTSPTTTTTTLDTEALCDELKVASFDLDEGLTTAFGDLTDLTGDEIDEEELGRAILTEIADFYDRIGELAVDAPNDLAPGMEQVSAAAEAAREALDAPLGDSLPGIEPGDVDPEISAAARRVSEWVAAHCGSEIAFDPSEVVLTTVMGAMFGMLGSAFGDLESLFEEALGGGLTEGLGEGFEGGFADLDALVYGDDPELDALWDDCALGDGDACEELYFSAYGEYETFAQTCGGTIPFRPALSVDCSTKLLADGPSSYGDDAALDGLWNDCKAGDDEACDALVGRAPFDSDYESYGLTCGDRRPADSRPCEFESSGAPFGYGDDPAFDALWDACSVGDETACSDLFFETPFDSVYERFGSACGDLVRAGRDCATLAELLGGPVG